MVCVYKTYPFCFFLISELTVLKGVFISPRNPKTDIHILYSHYYYYYLV